MKRVIVDYAKLTNEILNLLVEKFPDGYDDSHIVRFKNAKGELIEAVEVRTEDTIYLVKVSTKLATRLENLDDDDIDDVVEPIDAIKEIDIDDEDETSDEDDENDEDLDKPDLDPDDDEDSDHDDIADIEDDDDEE
ncbi:MAG: DNA primase [Flavobacterium sp.]|nr:DNA primase [Flavobacterium sp.]